MTQQTSKERELLIAYSNLTLMNAGRVKVLRQCFGSLSEVRSASSKAIAQLLRITEDEGRVVRDPLQLPEIRRKVGEQQAFTITLADSDYPSRLAEIHDPPSALHFAGDAIHLSSPSLAIVGSRRASPYGINAARRLTRDLAAAGLTIVSGFARGIDAAAHTEAVDSSAPTVAVLGTGIDVDYPRGQRALRRAIEANGIVISEFPPGTAPMAMNFPIRNRIIAGLTLGTIVVEASLKSGSLITARLAADEGREVFAVPGSIFSAGSEGAHRLAQSGAKLVHDANDVLDELGESFRRPTAKEQFVGSEEEMKLLGILDYATPIHVDAIASALDSTTAAIAETLLKLELISMIRAVPGQRYVRSANGFS